jgi:hypothetical protein
VATKEGRKQADEVRAKARRLRLDVAAMKRDATALLNGLKTETWAVTDPTIARLDAIETNAKDQIAVEDKKEQDRKDRHEEAIRCITDFGLAPPSDSEGILARLNSLSAIVVDDSYEEFQDRAEKVRDEVRASLQHAMHVATAREREDRKRQEQEAVDTARRAKIQAMKDLIAQVEGTDLENVRAALRIHQATEPTAAEFGDMLDYAEAVHFKTAKQLEELVTMLGLAEEHEREEAQQPTPPPTPAPREPDMEPSDVSMPLNPEPARGDEPVDDAAERRLNIASVPQSDTQWTPAQREEIAAAGLPPLVVNRLPARRPIPRPVPSAPLVATPEGDRGPIEGYLLVTGTVADPRAGLDMTESEVPDLLEAARAVLDAFGRLPRHVTVEWTPDPAHDYDPGPENAAFLRAIAALGAAVDFINEFAD